MHDWRVDAPFPEGALSPVDFQYRTRPYRPRGVQYRPLLARSSLRSRPFSSPSSPSPSPFSLSLSLGLILRPCNVLAYTNIRDRETGGDGGGINWRANERETSRGVAKLGGNTRRLDRLNFSPVIDTASEIARSYFQWFFRPFDALITRAKSIQEFGKEESPAKVVLF